MPLRKTFVWPLLAAMLLGSAAALLLRPTVPVTLRSGTALPLPRPIGEFELVDQRGRALTRSSFEGRWSLVFTGFTNCPDICPTTLALFATLASRLQTVFVSVDPERDTPSQLAQYVGYFDPSMIGATGPKAQIERLCAELGLAYVLNPGTAGEYAVDHSAALVLVDPKVRVAAYFQPPHNSDALVVDLSTLMGGAD
jgi:protein SCO1/2